MQTVGSRGEQGCLPNNGDGKKGRGAPAGPAALLLRPFRGHGERKSVWVWVIGCDGDSTLNRGESDQKEILLHLII